MEINGVNVHNSNQKDVAEMIRVSGGSILIYLDLEKRCHVTLSIRASTQSAQAGRIHN